MSTNTRMAEALRDAATSLETIGRLAGKPYYGRDDQGEPIQTYMGHNDEVRSYAKSRAGCAREALAAHDAEQAQQAAGQEQDERDAFEAWATEYSTIPLERDDDDRLGTTGYTVMDQTMLWDAWQAAMTRAREAVESVPVPRTWDFATSRHSWVTSQDLDDYRAAVLRALGEQ